MKHNVKAMVLELKQSEEDVRRNFQDEEEEQNEARLKEKRIQRTKRGLEILAERGTGRPGPSTSGRSCGVAASRTVAGASPRGGGGTRLSGFSSQRSQHLKCHRHRLVTLH